MWRQVLTTNETWRRSIINSLIIGSGATVGATVLGTFAALGLRSTHLPFVNTIRTIFLMPMVIPAVVLGVEMQMLYARIGLASSYPGVIIAHVVLCIPFVVVSVSGSLNGMDPWIEHAAASLGASPFRVFRLVTLPTIMPGVITGAVFAFATPLDEVVLTLSVAGPNQRTLARQMFASIRENISPAVAAAVFVMIVGTLCLAAMAAFIRSDRARSNPSLRSRELRCFRRSYELFSSNSITVARDIVSTPRRGQLRCQLPRRNLWVRRDCRDIAEPPAIFRPFCDITMDRKPCQSRASTISRGYAGAARED